MAINAETVLPYALGGVTGGAISTIMGRKTPKLNLQPLIDSINASRTRQTGIVNGLSSNLRPLDNTLSNDLSGAMDKADYSSQEKAKSFLTDLGKSVDLQGKELSDTLRQRVMQGQPEQQANLREQLAATGGLNRGAAGAAMTNLTNTNANTIGQGERDITLQTQQARQKGLETVFNMDNNLIQQRLGIDKETAMALYNSGRTDLINEANQMLGIEQDTTGKMLGIQETQASADFAKKMAQQQQIVDLMKMMIQGGAMVGGTMLGGPMGGAAASTGASSLTSTFPNSNGRLPTGNLNLY